MKLLIGWIEVINESMIRCFKFKELKRLEISIVSKMMFFNIVLV